MNVLNDVQLVAYLLRCSDGSLLDCDVTGLRFTLVSSGCRWLGSSLIYCSSIIHKGEFVVLIIMSRPWVELVAYLSLILMKKASVRMLCHSWGLPSPSTWLGHSSERLVVAKPLIMSVQKQSKHLEYFFFYSQAPPSTMQCSGRGRPTSLGKKFFGQRHKSLAGAGQDGQERRKLRHQVQLVSVCIDWSLRRKRHWFLSSVARRIVASWSSSSSWTSRVQSYSTVPMEKRSLVIQMIVSACFVSVLRFGYTWTEMIWSVVLMCGQVNRTVIENA